MKLRIVVWLIISVSLFGCQDEVLQNPSSESEEVTNMVDEQLYDIRYLFEAPRAEEKHDLTSVIKVVFLEGSGSTLDTIAIDVEHNKIYLEPQGTNTGIEAKTGSVPITDAPEVINILDKYDVQHWKEGPDFLANDFGWALWLQFEDGTVEKYGDSETTTDMKKYRSFIDELWEFVKARVIKLDPKIM